MNLNDEEIKRYASNCMCVFLSILNRIKVYHWQTLSYSRHIATDELHENLSKLIDRFIEVLTGRLDMKFQGKYRITINENSMYLKDYINNNDLELIQDIKTYLESKDLLELIQSYPDLLNIRDEMLAEVNKTGYLFTLN